MPLIPFIVNRQETISKVLNFQVRKKIKAPSVATEPLDNGPKSDIRLLADLTQTHIIIISPCFIGLLTIHDIINLNNFLALERYIIS